MIDQFALVVDDSLLIRRAVRRYLEGQGFVVDTAGNGWEALEILEQRTPQLIVTDLVMPRMDGQDFIRHLRRQPETARIPIVVIAGRRGSVDYVTGADFVIYKDIDIVEQLQLALGQIPVSNSPLTRNKAI